MSHQEFHLRGVVDAMNHAVHGVMDFPHQVTGAVLGQMETVLKEAEARGEFQNPLPPTGRNKR